MKRYGNLYTDIINFQNLTLAANKAQKGKRFKENVLEFNYNRERELIILEQELRDKTYQHGNYKTFYIREPKIRMISAAPYRDRVVHHALCNIINPIFERTFINNSYANRVGFGTHKALRKFIQYSRTSRYVLQCDIEKYFPSIDHEILKIMIEKKIKCRDTLWLIESIIDNSNEQIPVNHCFDDEDLLTSISRRKGLPMGNLTSQFFANIFLNGLDHFVKENLKVNKYLRYVDDFSLFSDEREFLCYARQEIEKYLASIKLRIHSVKSQLFETKIGATFVGFRVFPDRVKVKNDNLHRGRRRIKRLKQELANGTITLEEMSRSLQSWFAHLQHGDTRQLREKLFDSLISMRN